MFKRFLQNVCDTLGPKKEPVLSNDVLRMSLYINTSYTPEDRVMLIDGIIHCVMNKLSDEIKDSEKIASDAGKALQQLLKS